jgi:cytoskeleton protein RodZ
MPPIGETLREARMRQKLDIADVEDRTKIRAKYLRALENEEWALLPGPTFVKTFLRTYAEVVGVDPHLLVEEYRAGHETPDTTELAPLGPSSAPPRRRTSGGRDRRPPPRRSPPGAGLVLGGVAVVVVVFLLLLGLVGGGKDKKDSGSASTTTQTTAKTSPATTPKPKPKPVATGVTVKITPADPTYVCLDKGAGTPVLFEGTLSQPRTFKDAQHVRLNLGKRGAAVTLNGKPVKITESPDPVGFDFTTSATKELPAGSRPCA